MEKRRHTHWPCDNPGPWAAVWLESLGYRDCTRYNADPDPNYLCLHMLTAGLLRLKTGNGVNVVLSRNDLFAIWPHMSCQFFPEHPYRPDQI